MVNRRNGVISTTPIAQPDSLRLLFADPSFLITIPLHRVVKSTMHADARKLPVGWTIFPNPHKIPGHWDFSRRGWTSDQSCGVVDSKTAFRRRARTTKLCPEGCWLTWDPR